MPKLESKMSSSTQRRLSAKKKTASARAESTFRGQPKAQKQGRSKARGMASYSLEALKGQKDLGKIFGLDSKEAKARREKQIKKTEEKIKKIDKKRAKEKAKRKKLSGGSRQSQKRRQGGY